MSRCEHQHAELVRLCTAGSVARAIDLAFGHLAEFGPDDDLLAVMRDALEQRNASDGDWRRFEELGRC